MAKGGRIIVSAVGEKGEKMAKWLTEAESMADIWEGKCTITPLVECKDCAYRVEANTSDGSAWCSQLDGLMPPDWFCADGKKKENE